MNNYAFEKCKSSVIKNAGNIVRLFFIAFTPVVLITLTFPLADIYHIYVMGHQIGELEKRINRQSNNQNLLTWEHVVCPVVYGGEKVRVEHIETKLTNTIALGDVLLLAPAILALCAVSTVISGSYIYEKLGCLYTVGYILIIAYMITIIVSLALKVKHYTKANGPIAGLVSARHKSAENAEQDKKC